MSSMLANGGRNLRSQGFVWLLAALVASACGCVEESNRYTIVMTAHGDSLERSIRIKQFQGGQPGALRPDLEPGVEERLYAAYRVSVDTARTAPYVARGRFADVPDDIGTQGHYRHMKTPLGESFFYAERMRGMDDPAGWIERRFASADTLAAMVTDWLRFELVTQPEWPRVSGALEPELRAIARTAAALLLVAGDADSLQEGWALSLAPERPLFALLGVPLLEDSAQVLQFAPYIARARADLVRRLGLRSAADETRVLGFLADGPAATASYRRWAERAPDARAFDHSAAERILSAMTDDPRAHAGTASIEVELRVPQKPFTTNGVWNDSLGCVQWSGSCAALEHRDIALPLACAAMWSVPDSVVQRRLFGHVVLDDEELYNYADWFTTLTPGRQAEWNRMLLALRPGRLGPLERFRFAGERGATDVSASVRTTILDELSVLTTAERARARAKPASPPRKK